MMKGKMNTKMSSMMKKDSKSTKMESPKMKGNDYKAGKKSGKKC